MIFKDFFKTLTGYEPFPWQTRLYQEYFSKDSLPTTVDIPTGLGKTNVMAIWLIARAAQPALPRRLAYVVDRRAVVDQATEVAEQLRKNLEALPELKKLLGIKDSLPISTLRGQHVDNREWLEDPSGVAIIIGTVDMIGSRLLFQGYAATAKMRPYYAGLLGADCLVMLDEAHLVPPFEKLMRNIASDMETFGPRTNAHRQLIPRFRYLSLSATGRQQGANIFQLQDNDTNDAITKKRLTAEKHLHVLSVEIKELAEKMAEQAWKLARGEKAAIRCILFCNERDLAEKTKKQLDKLCKKKAVTELFVGARRIRERENAKQKLQDMGFIAGSELKSDLPQFLIATSAAEVGVDLDAEHMLCDLVAWERMVQRLGRVNRRGEHAAQVFVFNPGPPTAKKAEQSTTAEQSKIELHKAVEKLIQQLPLSADGSRDASPAALRDLKIRAVADANLQDILNTATTPAPLYPALTRATLESWTMTSLRQHTGRPPVAPWLRGWVEEQPQTTLVWRCYLPLRNDYLVTPKQIEDFFEAAPIHISEQLETETYRIKKWLKDRLAWLEKNRASTIKNLDIIGLIDSADGYIKIGKNELNNERGIKKLEKNLSGKSLILDARFGGINEEGLLAADTEHTPVTADSEQPWQTAKDPVIRFRIQPRLSNTEYLAKDTNWQTGFIFVTKTNEDGEATNELLIEKWRHDSNHEEDRALGPAQLLDDHHQETGQKAQALAQRLGLNDNCTNMLVVAARLHDAGKRASSWQRAFNAKSDGIYAKTKGPFNHKLLNGYRHELGSLFDVTNSGEWQTLNSDLQELVLHTVASHHGWARPFIPISGCETVVPSQLEEYAQDIALRFARLQSEWGPWGLAWWEALLRAADQQASKANAQRSVSIKKENI